ncbi:hypothetical protein PBI_EQUEMIOH13_8 [Mycobacterium phage Equemioh13]|uniref:Uncharacterized protein n=1 Tax=Mycobacterium phage Centaur TaxID=2488784 RepID=A0A3G8FF26_9CAUD|nr:hypothetical protein AVT12_gp08 [Mycobacterium phage Equemioh13]YP_010063624.1 hypothetical protein KIY82_gp08 [Mycobacterium phage Centaur]ATN92244.1 hypothetical protein SEA_UPDAWG_8 [Mycobacterium phage Updawg]QDM57210.1 hypothetical protein SEA_WIDEWALE_8 [Mycobacterium phage WideWale]AIT13325.1 hypothetical protein PBI_EQUEMIOH13_8 [Mycobacterium phage Equemioh13]AZF93393.1 hypothetical protein SEA_CENTAUR_8 [Mycobacterium phage Centaur]
MLFETMIQVAVMRGSAVEAYYFLDADYGLDTQAGRDAVVEAIESVIADLPEGSQVYAIALNVVDKPQRPNGEVVNRSRMVQLYTPGDYTPFWDFLGPVT